MNSIEYIKKNSTQDFLTGLNNTRNFDKLVNETFVQAKENKFDLSCFMVDIDHFKKVNDTYGHPVGDIVLKELAYILKNNCRSFDIIGRVGGEEFCILLLDCGQEEAFQIASRIRKAVKIYDFEIGNKEYINITVSIGVSTYPDKVIELDKLKEWQIEHYIQQKELEEIRFVMMIDVYLRYSNFS